ncbi:hypothetical protein B0H14DRAFT_2927963 [Mycena olivaceomarginata]|nr:hypothetical protein B0H14DRAFT_2927963 [Mycena olivaceomarginata]
MKHLAHVRSILDASTLLWLLGYSALFLLSGICPLILFANSMVPCSASICPLQPPPSWAALHQPPHQARGK